MKKKKKSGGSRIGLQVVGSCADTSRYGGVHGPDCSKSLQLCEGKPYRDRYVC